MEDIINAQETSEQTLKENLQRTLAILNHNKALADEYGMINDVNAEDEKYWVGAAVKVLGILSPAAILYLFWIISNMKTTDKIVALVIVIPVAFAAAVLICELAQKICWYKGKKKRDSRVAANKETISKIQEQYSGNMKLLDTFSEIPPMYRHADTVEIILHYIVNRRADTIKEAINLYESDWRCRERLEELKESGKARLRMAGKSVEDQ